MREILFRGKRKDNSEWIEGFLVVVGKWYYIFTGKLDIAKGVVAFECFEVIPETVGEYAGLTDKNGKKIFEGDIVKFCDIIGIINYNMGCYCVKTNKPDWRSRTNPAIDIIMNEYTNEIEIIGNVHDKPELLEASSDEKSL